MDLVVDAATIAALGIGSTGVALWLITQWHLLRTGKAIKADIDAKRTATEAFVHTELEEIRKLMGAHQATLTAQIPPNVHGELEDVRAEIEQINVGLRKEFESLPARILEASRLSEGPRTREMMLAAKDLNEGLKAELAGVEAGLPPEIQGMDIRGKVLKAIAREPTAKERKDMGMLGELIWTAGRAKLAEWVQGQGPPGASVTYRVTNKSPYGL